MKSNRLYDNTPDLATYQAVNCSGKDLGIVDGVVRLDNRKGLFVQLSTHYKDLFGDIKYAVPFDLCDINHDKKIIRVNVEKNELDFLYKMIDLYDRKISTWDEDVDMYFNYPNNRFSHSNSQSFMN